jgi:hypothetical protein
MAANPSLTPGIVVAHRGARPFFTVGSAFAPVLLDEPGSGIRRTMPPFGHVVAMECRPDIRHDTWSPATLELSSSEHRRTAIDCGRRKMAQQGVEDAKKKKEMWRGTDPWLVVEKIDAGHPADQPTDGGDATGKWQRRQWFLEADGWGWNPKGMFGRAPAPPNQLWSSNSTNLQLHRGAGLSLWS